MTDQLSPLAVQNAGLLRALQQGPFETPAAPAERAGIVPNNLHRKLDSLEAEGLIVRAADAPKHVADLTETAERALAAIAVYQGAAIQMGVGRALIPFNLIDAWTGNPRTQFDPASDEEMAQSIADKGVLQALIVRPNGAGRFEVVIGERRRRGSRLAVERGWQPADFAVPCEIRDLTDDEALEIAGVENLQREDMHWMDEAKWYERLAGRLSGAQIERLVGGQRKKRSIQDYIKIARELSAEDIGRTYLDEKHKDYLPYVRARDMVGDKKERPALDLTPKLRLALLELITAGEQEGRTVITKLHAAPSGGPLGALQDRKLITFGFANRELVCRIPISEDLAKYLQQIGWYDDELGCLRTARVDAVGELQTSSLAPFEYITPELNAPKTAEPPHSPPPMGDGNREAVEVAETPGGPKPEAADPTPPAQTSQNLSLPPMLQIVLIELAHRIAHRGVERGPGTWATEVLVNYYKDARGMQLVQQHRMLAFMPTGHKTLAALAKRGLEWLTEYAGIEVTPAGQPIVHDAVLHLLQQELGFKPEAGAYSTPWLNDPAPDPLAQPEPEPAAHAPAQAPEPAPAERPGRDEFARQILAVTSSEIRAMARMAAALREARIAIRNARSTKLTAAQVSQMEALIDSALQAAAPHLNDEPSHA